MKNVTFYKFDIEPNNDLRVDQLLASYLPEYSRSRIKSWINDEKILINGKSCSPKDKLTAKSQIEIEIKPNEELDIIIEKEKNINKLKILLANSATKILHGEKVSKNSEITAKETFETRGIGKDLPEIKIQSKKFKEGLNILDLLSDYKITNSKSDARRSIKGMAISINDEKIKDENKIIKLDNFSGKDFLKISFGKKKHYLIKLV